MTVPVRLVTGSLAVVLTAAAIAHAPFIAPDAVLAQTTTSSPGIWISKSELSTKPMSGDAWTNVVRWAGRSCPTPDLANQDDLTNVCVLAKALVVARTDNTRLRLEVINALWFIVGSGTYNGRALALGRELAAYVIAADLVEIKKFDPTLDRAFRTKIREYLTTPTTSGPRNLIECHELRPNNWGTHCGASRVAVAAYLGDQTQLDRAAKVLKGFLGDRSSHAGFRFQTGSTQQSQTWSPNGLLNMVPVNPRGGTVLWNGKRFDVDGAVIDDISRGCATFRWTPCHTGYPWEGLAGVIMQAEMLHRRGYAPYQWQDQAVRRAYEYLLRLHRATGGYWFDEGTISGDDNWQPWIVNRRYGTALPRRTPTRPGKAMGFTDWTH